MKVIVLIWRGPDGSVVRENLDASKYKIHTDPGWLKLHSEEAGKIIRILPVGKVEAVEFRELEVVTESTEERQFQNS